MKRVLVCLNEETQVPVIPALEDIFHPYEDPKFVFLKVIVENSGGNFEKYQNWVEENNITSEFITKTLNEIGTTAVKDEVGMIIVDYAKSIDADHIVMTKRVHNSFHKLLYGDTEQYVVENAMWPVSIIPDGVAEVEGEIVGQYAGMQPK